jgi:NitT/TauT family transport system substrate-binding protein
VAAFGTRGQLGPLEVGKYPIRFLPRPSFADQFITGNVVARSDLNADQERALKGCLRAYAKSIVFTKANPEAAIRISWNMYPDGKPKSVAEDQALASAVAVNKSYMSYIDKEEEVDGVDLRLDGHAPFPEQVVTMLRAHLSV